jgi:4-hydroxythreonine-4-phosphate dehydrogenase
MKQGGLGHEDELHHFAEYLGVDGFFCEFNTLDGLWTARVSPRIADEGRAEAT